MCDLIPSLECPECAYNLPDEHHIDPSFEMDGDDYQTTCPDCHRYPCKCDYEPDPDYARDQELLWDMEINK